MILGEGAFLSSSGGRSVKRLRWKTTSHLRGSEGRQRLAIGGSGEERTPPGAWGSQTRGRAGAPEGDRLMSLQGFKGADVREI